MLKELFHSMEVTEDTAENKITPAFRITDWFENKHGALSISFDDASMTQYTEGVPVMDKYGIKATFALVSESMNENPSFVLQRKGNFSIEKIRI